VVLAPSGSLRSRKAAIADDDSLSRVRALMGSLMRRFRRLSSVFALRFPWVSLCSNAIEVHRV
jgi:hypothetical protein